MKRKQKEQTDKKKYSKYNKEESEEYEKTYETFKKLFAISPATVDHLWRIGYHSVESIAESKNTPGSLAREMTNYLIKTKKVNEGKPYNYEVVFRRILFIARSSEEERNAFPEHTMCKHWSRVGLQKRGLDIGEDGCVVPLMKDENDEKEGKEGKEGKEEKEDTGGNGGKKGKTGKIGKGIKDEVEENEKVEKPKKRVRR